MSTNDIRATEPDDVWFNVRFSELNLHLNTAFGAWSIPLSVLRSLLAHWGGIAGMVGGVLWMALFALLQLHDTILYAEHPSEGWLGSTSFEIFQILSVLDIRLLGAPLLLLIAGLIGFFASCRASLGWLGRVGFAMSLVGFSIVALQALVARNPCPGCLSSGNFLLLNGYVPTSIEEWYFAIYSGLLILAPGIALFGIAAIRAKVLPASGVALLILSAFGISLLHPVAHLLGEGYFDGYNIDRVLGEFGIFTCLALLFGAGWVWLGNMSRLGRSTEVRRG